MNLVKFQKRIFRKADNHGVFRGSVHVRKQDIKQDIKQANKQGTALTVSQLV
jgi:hypothetical protein